MKFYQHIISMLMLSIFFTACSNKKEVDKTYEKKVKEAERENVYLFENTREPFYTVDPKLEDIESEIAMLKEKVIQYESEIATPNFNTEILKLIKSPKIKHEIQLSNGTIIQGTIIYENADQLILETQIGQLQINKNEIIKTNEVLPPIAKLEFIGDAIEEIYDNKRAYQGSIRNDGLKRADFVRVIYTMHDENSDLIAIDSAFISGSKQIFKSGIISDASIEPGEFSDFYVIINIEDDTNIKYFLRDIKWEYFD